jgi:hypothetical protein
MTPEGRIKEKIKRMFKRYGSDVKYHMPVQNGMGEPTLDFTAAVRGFMFVIETKAPGKKPTVRQAKTLDEYARAGAFCFVVDSDEGVALVEEYIKLIVL